MTQVEPVIKAKKRRKAKPATDKAVATRLHSQIVRHYAAYSDGCEAAGMWGIECFGALQCAHVVPRRFAATRTDLSNARALCLAHHSHVDKFHLMRELVGGPELDRLIAKADRGPREFSGLTPTMWWREERARLTEIAQRLGII